MERVRLRLLDILRAIATVERIVAAIDNEAFKSSIEHQWMLERGIEIISEAVRRIPGELIANHPGIPWHDIRGIGNRIRHDYDRIDPQILWTIATRHLTDLKPVIEAILAKVSIDLPPEI